MISRLILQPKLEFQLYGKDDPENGVGSGLANAELGLRLRYEIRREFALYVGILRTRSFGETADLARAAVTMSMTCRWSRGCACGFDRNSTLS